MLKEAEFGALTCSIVSNIPVRMRFDTYTCKWYIYFVPNLTLYLNDSTLESVNQLKSQIGGEESLSAIFGKCVQDRLAALANTPISKMGKITLTLWNADEQPTIKKSFTGRWLVNGLGPDDDSNSGVIWGATSEWSVAQTQKGAIVVYASDSNEGCAPEMSVYDSFSEFRDAEDSGNAPMHPTNVIAAVAGELDEPYEIELDI